MFAKLGVIIQCTFSFVCELTLEKNFSQSLRYIKGTVWDSHIAEG